jgi:hypothetical protein
MGSKRKFNVEYKIESNYIKRIQIVKLSPACFFTLYD